MLVFLLAGAVSSTAQETDPYAKVRAAMEASAEKQRAALAPAQTAAAEKQRAAARSQARAAQAGDPFYTIPWKEPLTELLMRFFGPGCEPVPEGQMQSLVEQISRLEGLSPDLLRAVIHKESAFLPCAISRKGAQGLMQLMPETAARFGVRDPFDPAENVSAGAKLLGQLIDRYDGDLALALGAYNAGPSRVDALRTLPPFPETLDYVSSVLAALRRPPGTPAAEKDQAPPQRRSANAE